MESITLGDHFLHIDSVGDGHTLRLVGPGGGQRLEIAITPQGPVLRLGGNLRVELTGDLAVEARRIALHGREGLALSSGADGSVQVVGDLAVTADLGDVSIRANDDVRIDGERVRMNC